MSLALQETAGGVLLPVKAAPGAKRDAVVGLHGGALRVQVRAAPEKGKANEALADVLAEALGVRRAEVELRRGGTSAAKVFFIAGRTAAEVEAKLRQMGVLPPAPA